MKSRSNTDRLPAVLRGNAQNNFTRLHMHIISCSCSCFASTAASLCRRSGLARLLCDIREHDSGERNGKEVAARMVRLIDAEICASLAPQHSRRQCIIGTWGLSNSQVRIYTNRNIGGLVLQCAACMETSSKNDLQAAGESEAHETEQAFPHPSGAPSRGKAGNRRASYGPSHTSSRPHPCRQSGTIDRNSPKLPRGCVLFPTCSALCQNLRFETTDIGGNAAASTLVEGG
jgi:hypothetical protein